MPSLAGANRPEPRAILPSVAADTVRKEPLVLNKLISGGIYQQQRMDSLSLGTSSYTLAMYKCSASKVLQKKDEPKIGRTHVLSLPQQAIS